MRLISLFFLQELLRLFADYCQVRAYLISNRQKNWRCFSSKVETRSKHKTIDTIVRV